MPLNFEPLLAALKEAALPAVWSRGVSLAREKIFQVHQASSDEIVVLVHPAGRPAAFRATLWPGLDKDSEPEWHCDCGDQNDPCVHVIAAVLAHKAGNVTLATEETAGQTGRIEYRLSRSGPALRIERWSGSGKIDGPLTAAVLRQTPRIAATQEDFALDPVFATSRDGVIAAASAPLILRALGGAQKVTLDGRVIAVRAVGSPQASAREVFSASGLELADGIIGPIYKAAPPPEPQVDYVDVEPQVSLQSETLEGGVIVVIAEIQYPPTPDGTVARRRPELERALELKLRHELHLSPGQPSRFRGAEAAAFFARLPGWIQTSEKQESLRPVAGLEAQAQLADDGTFSVRFALPDGREAASDAVWSAWRSSENYVSVAGGGWAKLPADWLEKYGAQARDLLESAAAHRPTEAGPGVLPKARWFEAAELSRQSGGTLPTRLRDFVATLSADPLSLEPDASAIGPLWNALRAYQKTGAQWLAARKTHGLGAVLADEMGLGKTLQALAALDARAGTISLIAAPKSVIFSWSDHLARYRPDLHVRIYHGQTRERGLLRPDPGASVVVLTSHSLVRQDIEPLREVRWDTVIVDEAQAIRNPESQLAQAVCLLEARFRLALTGTPIENDLSDLWSLFRFVEPELLGERQQFMERWRRGGDHGPSGARAKIRPFLLRRRKSDVDLQLPPKTEQILHCTLSEPELDLYQSVLAATQEQVELGAQPLALLEALLRLRQACCHPALVPGAVHSGTSAKTALLLEKLSELTASGHRALVFSQWTSLLDLIEPALRDAGIRFGRLDGSTQDREQVVGEFQSPSGPPVFLISLKAGGVGLTLTAADHVFFMDPWWNPAVEAQAADRIHRIGQDKPVFIYRLVAEGTIEDRVLALQDSKRALIAEALSENDEAQIANSRSGPLNRDELIALISSL